MVYDMHECTCLFYVVRSSFSDSQKTPFDPLTILDYMQSKSSRHTIAHMHAHWTVCWILVTQCATSKLFV